MAEEPKKDSKIELLRKEVTALKERIDDLEGRLKALEEETW